MNVPRQGIPLRPDVRALASSERRSFVRAITGAALACSKGGDPVKLLRSAWPDDSRAQTILRSAVGGASTADYPTYDPISAFRSLAPGSAAAALFALSPNQLDMQGISTVRVPNVLGLPPVPIFIGEGQPGPAPQYSLQATVVGPVRKVLLLAAVTRELENASPQVASTVIGRVLADLSNMAIDLVAFGTAPDDGVQPPGLLANAAPLTPAAAGDSAMSDDLGALVEAIGAARIDPSDAVIIAGPREAMILKCRVGVRFDNIILTTLGLPPKTIVAVAPSAVFVAYDGTPTIETSSKSAYNFADPASEIVDGSGAAASPVFSLFQTDVISIRVRADSAWNVVPGGAQLISGINW